MVGVVDRVFGCLLLIGAALHSFGSFRLYGWPTPELVWALSASFAAGLLAVVNLLRSVRPGDRALAWICFGGCLCWIALAAAFGLSIRNLFDPRALYHVVAALVLAGFSLRALRR